MSSLTFQYIPYKLKVRFRTVGIVFGSDVGYEPRTLAVKVVAMAERFRTKTLSFLRPLSSTVPNFSLEGRGQG